MVNLIIILVLISIPVYFYINQRKIESDQVTDINLISKKVNEYMALTKHGARETLQEKSRVLEKEINFYMKIKGFKNIYKFQPGILGLLHSDDPDKKPKFNFWHRINGRTNEGEVIEIFNTDPKTVIKLWLVLENNEITIAQVNNKSEIDKLLLVISENDDSYEIKVFEPGEWVIELIKGFMIFHDKLVSHIAQVKMNGDL